MSSEAKTKTFFELEEGKAYKVLPKPEAWYSFNIEHQLQISQSPFLVVKLLYTPGKFDYTNYIKIRYAKTPGGPLDTYGNLQHRLKIPRKDPQPLFQEVPLNSVKEAGPVFSASPKYIFDSADFFHDIYNEPDLDVTQEFMEILDMAKDGEYMRQEFDVSKDQTSITLDVRETQSSGISAVTVTLNDKGQIELSFYPTTGNPWDTPYIREKLLWIFSYYIIDTHKKVIATESLLKNVFRNTPLPENVQGHISAFLTGHKKPVSKAFSTKSGGRRTRKSRNKRKLTRRRK